jgi:ribosomal protein S21
MKGAATLSRRGSQCHDVIGRRTGNPADQRGQLAQRQREGIFREMKLRGHYEKPSERRVREKAEAIRRARKLARKTLQREGLLPNLAYSKTLFS